jgi:hypothetical protein
MTKRDLFLLGVGTCFGMLICSVMAFLLVISNGPIMPTPTSVPPSTQTVTPTLVYTKTITPTATITGFPKSDAVITLTHISTNTPIPPDTNTPEVSSDGLCSIRMELDGYEESPFYMLAYGFTDAETSCDTVLKLLRIKDPDNGYYLDSNPNFYPVSCVRYYGNGQRVEIVAPFDEAGDAFCEGFIN